MKKNISLLLILGLTITAIFAQNRTSNYNRYPSTSSYNNRSYNSNLNTNTTNYYPTSSSRTIIESHKQTSVTSTPRPTEHIRHYNNSNGERVQSPTRYTSTPAGATAECRDGSFSFSRSRRGTCSHHGGVRRWL